MRTQIKTAIFDLQGVILHRDSAHEETYLRYLSNVSGKPRENFQTKQSIELFHRFEEGKLSVREFEYLIARLSGIPVSKIRWVDFYRKEVKIDEDVLDLVRKLRVDYETISFTNMDRGRYKATLEIIGTGIFDRQFASCFIGTRKPSPLAFRKVLRKIGVKANQTVFIDDDEQNVEGAKVTGMNGILFTDVNSLRLRLSEFGIELRV